MKRGGTKVYMIGSTLLLTAGFLLVFAFAWQGDLDAKIEGICGLFIGFALAPIVHELGHVTCARIADMKCVYLKCFCFRMVKKGGKTRFSLASPFAPDETQVLPNRGGNMRKRAQLYTIGGLLFSGIFLAIIFLAALLCTLLKATNYLLWGILPYSTYLFMLNVFPAEYGEGKTDMLVYIGIKKGSDSEKTMLSAMEIQGRLAEGKSFSEIDEKYYFDLPVLREDEPLFAVMLDLKYRFYLEKEEYDKAAECINRLAGIQAYLSDEQVEKLAAELVYLHSLQGNVELAEESGKLCMDYLKSDDVTAKRVLAAFSLACGKADGAEVLLAQAEEGLRKEPIKGLAKFEKRLLDRMKNA